jgi:hypothetical protein
MLCSDEADETSYAAKATWISWSVRPGPTSLKEARKKISAALMPTTLGEEGTASRWRDQGTSCATGRSR